MKGQIFDPGYPLSNGNKCAEANRDACRCFHDKTNKQTNPNLVWLLTLDCRPCPLLCGGSVVTWLKSGESPLILASFLGDETSGTVSDCLQFGILASFFWEVCKSPNLGHELTEVDQKAELLFLVDFSSCTFRGIFRELNHRHANPHYKKRVFLSQDN